MLGRLRHKHARTDDLLSRPILHWSREDAFTFRDAVAGTAIMGATGSGKSSGSGRALASAFLRNGCGGIVLAAKSDELNTWITYCKESRRSDDLVVFDAAGSHKFNFLDYEMTRPGAGAGITENIVNLLSNILEVSERNSSGSGGRESETYWKNTQRQLTRNVVDLLALSRTPVSVPNLYRAVVSAATSPERLRCEEWRRTSACYRWLAEADKQVMSPRERTDFGIVADYWCLEFPNLAEKTRSIITSSFFSMVDILNRGLLRDLFSTDTTITPDAVAEGKIILVGLSAKEFGEVGLFANALWKYAFQRSIERRPVRSDTLPVFLWADEAQHFLNSYDMQFMTTCRGARVATVMLSQNYSNFVAALGAGEKGRVEADSLLANLNTKILHANGDPVTNEWAAGLIGKSIRYLASGNSSRPSDDGLLPLMGVGGQRQPGSISAGFSESLSFEVEPREFTRLRTGGPEYAGVVDGIVFANGKTFKASGRGWLPVQFRQRSEAAQPSRYGWRKRR